MPSCAVSNCGNHNRKTRGLDIKYFRFPKDSDLANQWLSACKRKDRINLKNACICSEHFEQNSYDLPLRYRLLNYNPKNSRTLKPDAVPTLHLPEPVNVDTGQRRVSVERVEIKQEPVEIEECNGNWEFHNKMENPTYNSVTSNISTISQQHLEQNNRMNKSSNKVTNIQWENNLLRVQMPQNGSKYFVISRKDQQFQRNKEIQESKHKITELELENAQLRNQLEDLKNHYESTLTTIFTPGQIRKLFHSKGKGVQWSDEDFASALSLSRVSIRAYRYLRLKGYPLPALSTLRRWVTTNSHTADIKVENV